MGNIKHDIAKFVGVYKQVTDSRESGVSAEGLLERALEYYKDRHPKQHTFLFLHCWHILKEVPRWWQTPMDLQRRNSSQGVAAASVARGRASPVPAEVEAQVGSPCGDAAEVAPCEEEVVVVAKETFQSRPIRPQGNKAAKADIAEQGRKEAILKSTARATEQMAAANMRKAEAMADHAAMSIFRMPMEDLDEDA